MSKIVINNSNENRSLGFCGFLTLIFITLKLCEIIDWSWLWVLSPLWLPFTVIVLIILVFALIAGGIQLYKAYKKTKRKAIN